MSAALEPLPSEDADVVVVPMLTPSRAVDLYIGDCQRRRLAGRTLTSYRRILDKHIDDLPGHYDVTDVKPDDIRRTLDRWRNATPGTVANADTIIRCFYEWLYFNERIRRNPSDKIARPKKVPTEDLDVVTVSSDDVRKLLAACDTWTEKLAVGIPAYMGPRRRATSMLRVRDYDRAERLMRFREKGGKTIWKPVPDELAETIEAALAAGAYDSQTLNGSPIPRLDAYLVPPGADTRIAERNDRVIWSAVRRVADSIGVRTHVHALRAAFAVFYLENNPGRIEGLKALMGHKSIQTTQTYLRRLDRASAMENVRSLSWRVPEGSRSSRTFEESALMGAGGFEPPFCEPPVTERPAREYSTDDIGFDLARSLRAALERETA